MSGQPVVAFKAEQSQTDWDQAPCALVVVDDSFSLLRANSAFFRLTGIQETEAVGFKISHRFTKASQLYFESVLVPLLHIEGGCQEVALTLVGKTQPIPVLMNVSLQTWQGGRIYTLALFPASARRSFEEQLLALKHETERRASWLAQLEALSGVGAWTYEVRTGRMLWSDKIYDLYGIPHDAEIALETALGPLSPDVRKGIEAITENPELCIEPIVQELDFRHACGQIRRFKIAGQYSLNHHGEPVIQGVLQDITDAHNRQVDLWNAAHIDQMTSLGNRYLFNTELERRTDNSRNTSAFDLLVIDLDGFKAVNDTFGHHAGDAVLKEIGRRINQLNPSSGFRLGGDEFALILEKIEREIDADDFARRLLIEICRPVDIGRQEVSVSASIGISTYPSNGAGSDEILHAADCAMYAAKKAGRNKYVRFRPGVEGSG